MRLFVLSTVSVLALTVLTPSAQAAFEFVPSKPAPAAVAPASDANAPAISNAPVQVQDVTTAPANGPTEFGTTSIPLTPVVKQSDALLLDDGSYNSAPAMPAPISKPIVEAPKPNSDLLKESGVRATHKETKTTKIETEEMPSPAAPAKSVIATSDLDDGPAVQGFGRQVPLALALQQIVPASYRYSFDYGVDAGQRVSWTGGKPWKAVITDLARDNNMNVDIVNNVIAFHRRTPMEIVSASSGVDATPDMVQGMPLKPVASVMKTEQTTTIASTQTTDAPMSILEPYQPAEQKTEPRQSLGHLNDGDLPPPTQAAPVVAEKTTATQTESILWDKPVAKAESKPAKPVIKLSSDEAVASVPAKNDESYGAAKFDTLLDSDKPAAHPLKEKQIMVADDLPPVISPPKTTTTTVTETKTIEKAPAPDMPMTLAKPVETKAMPPTAPLPPLETKSLEMKPAAPIAPVTAMTEMTISSTTTSSGMAPADLNSSQEWSALKNGTLRQVLTEWSERAGVSLVWSSEYDYPLQTDVRIQGNYSDAVRTILAGFSKAQPRPLGRLFKNASVGGKPVLVVETQRLTN